MTKQFTLDETTSDLIICDNREPRFWVEEYDDIIEIIDLLNELNDKNEQLKQENQSIQDKVMQLLDYVEVKQCVTRTEIKKWWNGDV